MIGPREKSQLIIILVSLRSCFHSWHNTIQNILLYPNFFYFISSRHILAALHFNYNLHREEKVNKDGSVPLKVTYPKFKNGEATVRNLKIKPIFGIYLLSLVE